MPKKITEQEKREYLQNFGYELVKHVDGQTNIVKITIKHTECGYVYPVRFNDFKQGHRCPKCAGLVKRTEEDKRDENCYFIKNQNEFFI
jgi:hypothetical protein